ncbi:isoleucine--tRNA ligase [archaeon]|nr:isoleucine--tRNA ligase [archaeon]|tara:strand:- start:5405 stop:8578 length:3174 start_codon:yes stop_codon:yes gene_type:complete
MKFKEYSLDNETAVLHYWHSKKTVEALRKRGAGKKKYYFLQGPPYTSGNIHLGHAWNMSLKDVVLRYKRMQGLDVWDRNGYDMHGLPTEQKVMKKFNLKDKQDILDFGLDKFATECEKFCTEIMHIMDKDFKRLGTTFDFSNPYQPIKKEFISSVWWLVKQAHKKKRLYQGLRTMHWDAATASAVAKHELEYKSVTDTSIYIKFKRTTKGAPKDSHFVIWTTTPWTIPLNLAIMVNPDLDYVDVEVETNGGKEVWTLAKTLHESVLEKAKIKKFKVIKEYKGKKLEGKSYEHPLKVFDKLPENVQAAKKLFTVLLTKEYCDDTSGTGLVHTAPGCGPEDYEVGHTNGIPPFNCVNEEGFFADFKDEMNGLKAKDDDSKFIQMLDDEGVLIAKEKYTHDYPYGERSHEPVIFRTTKQWFFKMEDLKEKLLAMNEKVYWNPETSKNAFRSWLENLRDNSISKQRFWGTPIPIWKYVDPKTEEEEFIVVGSITELEKLSGQKVKNPHIPFIDDITIEKDGKVFKRVPDILDVWIDAGTASWNCLDYPQNEELIKRYFPADFILEGKDQIRGWFNLLMVASALGFDKLPFKNVYMHGFVTDVEGVKMSKSLGNITSPYEIIDKHGADVLRLYMASTTAGEDISFSWEEIVVKEKFLKIVWNLHKLLISSAKESGINPFALDADLEEMQLGSSEKYILSNLQSTLTRVTDLMETYRLDKVGDVIEALFFNLSRNYVQMVRDRLATGSKEEKEIVLFTVAKVMLDGLKMLQMFCPFVSEVMYLNLKEEFSLEEESISHYMWPKVEKKLMDTKLEAQMQTLDLVMQASLNAREKAKLGLRWPIKELVVVSADSKTVKAVESLRDLLKSQLNVKDITVMPNLPGVKVEAEVNMKTIGPRFGKQSPEVIKHLSKVKMVDVLSSIEEKGSYVFHLSDKSDAQISMNDLLVSREVPKGFTEGSFKGGFVYVNMSRSAELEAEGYARELMRLVQNERKKAGLEKTDVITLHLQVPKDLAEAVSKFTEMIQAKVGASHVLVESKKAAKKHKHTVEAKVKKQEFVISFDKE